MRTFQDYVNKYFGGPVGLDDLTDEDYDRLWDEWQKLKDEIRDKLITPTEKQAFKGMSDSEINKTVEKIAKKYKLAAEEVLDLYWNIW